MTSILLPIGGITVPRWLGVCVCLLLLQPAVAEHWVAQHKDKLPELVDVPQLNCRAMSGGASIGACRVDDNLLTWAFHASPNEQTTTTIAFEANAAKLFHSVADTMDLSIKDDDRVERLILEMRSGEYIRDYLHWEEAEQVAAQGLEKGLLMPMGVFKRSFVTIPSLSGLSHCLHSYDSPWSTKELMVLAQGVHSASTFLLDRGVTHSRFLEHYVVGNTDKTAFGISLLHMTFSENQIQQTVPLDYREVMPVTKPQDALYAIGEVLSMLRMGHGSPLEILYRLISSFTPSYVHPRRHETAVAFINAANKIEVAGVLKRIRQNDHEVYIRREEEMFQDFSLLSCLWLRIASHTPPYLSPRTNEQGDEIDEKKLNMFYAFAMIYSNEHQHEIAENPALKYLNSSMTENQMKEMLLVDVPRYLLPYSQYVENEVNRRRPWASDPGPGIGFLLNKLNEVADALLEVHRGGFIDISGYPQFVSTVSVYKNAVGKLIEKKLLFTAQITKTTDLSLHHVLSVVYTFSVLFPDLLEYLNSSGWTKADISKILDTGRAEYKTIEDKENVFGECFTILEAVAG
eukprot:GHVS01082029.1.p1 GENE.GHVS01082029.1~~GHVS01082029.1.p1  ORF type:complete len:573 (-),score=42.70 GHVS01082029.1:663-2381(-)